MNSIFGFSLDVWDYATFVVLIIIGLGFIALMVGILGLPGRIAISRNHPEADAVNLMGWIGFIAVVPWVQALIWAFKPTNVVDIRRGPREVAHETEVMIQHLKGGSKTETGTASPATTPVSTLAGTEEHAS